MKIIDALAIRDTSGHNSDILEAENVFRKTYIVENGLNQAVDLQWQASANADFSNSFNLGEQPFNVGAGVNTYLSCETLFPYVRVVATCSVAPSSGTLTLHAFKYTGA